MVRTQHFHFRGPPSSVPGLGTEIVQAGQKKRTNANRMQTNRNSECLAGGNVKRKTTSEGSLSVSYKAETYAMLQGFYPTKLKTCVCRKTRSDV